MFLDGESMFQAHSALSPVGRDVGKDDAQLQRTTACLP